ncbi:MAG: hypothetical protein RLZZ453_276 [Chlamydiota bacterium]|jgi:predicted Rossmann fold flavoprotein
MKKCIVIGGGAAGIFAAIICKQTPHLQVSVLEKSNQFLSKVKISGGGRCNVTHGLFDPRKLIEYYPRGSKELLGAFFRFQPKDMIAWLEEKGVHLKTEKDGRVFPVTDSSMTIVECLLNAAKKAGVELLPRKNVLSITPKGNSFEIQVEGQELLHCDFVVLATGGSTYGHALAKTLGHHITETAPSLFTFNVPGSPLKELSGISVQDAEITLPECSLKQRGALLITHFGFSGPAILKLSAFAARHLKRCDYKTTIKINWAPDLTIADLYRLKKEKPLKTLASENPTRIPQQLWKTLVPDHGKVLGHLSDASLQHVLFSLQNSLYELNGKTTHKEEFVTCGGIDLKEVDCTAFQSKLLPHLFFAGEVLDIDGVTGGFNFQNAWTTSYLAATKISSLIADKK